MAPSLQTSLIPGRGFLAMSPSPYPRFQPCAVLSVRAPCASVPRTVCGGFPKHAGAATEVSTGRHEYVLGCEGIFHYLASFSLCLPYAAPGRSDSPCRKKDCARNGDLQCGVVCGAVYLQNSRARSLPLRTQSQRNPRMGVGGGALDCFGGCSARLCHRCGNVRYRCICRQSAVDLSDSHLPTADSGACTPGQGQRAVICFGRGGSQDRTACRCAA